MDPEFFTPAEAARHRRIRFGQVLLWLFGGYVLIAAGLYAYSPMAPW